MSEDNRFTRLAMLAPAALVALLTQTAAPAQEPRRPLDLATYPRTTLEITHLDAHHTSHRYSFEVWVADTKERSQQGLMFVSDLPENLGMIFPFSPPGVETFWMENTYIELDLLFIKPDGRVSKIIARAEPMSQRPLSSDTSVAAVLELKGGEAARLGVKVGDTVSWKKPAS
jgi:uncharacterized protein